MSHLLDANALIALGWPPHEHHEPVSRWFRTQGKNGWSTCAFTQAAFVRVIAQPAFSGQPLGIADVAELLLRNTAHDTHRLLPVDFGFERVMATCTGGLLGHRQITDAWLLTTAVRHKVKLLTFDGGISQLLATPDERAQHLVVLR